MTFLDPVMIKREGKYSSCIDHYRRASNKPNYSDEDQKGDDESGTYCRQRIQSRQSRSSSLLSHKGMPVK